jgi:FtsZ-binding cell division protein ZapB
VMMESLPEMTTPTLTADVNVLTTPCRRLRFKENSQKQDGSPIQENSGSETTNPANEVPPNMQSLDDEVAYLKSRVKELEEENRKNSILIETLLQHKREYDTLRQQSSKGFKTLRSLGDSSPNTARRSGKDQISMSGKDIMFAAKSPSALSGKGLPPIDNPASMDAGKDEIISSQAVQITRLNEKLTASQARLQNPHITSASVMSVTAITTTAVEKLELDELKESLQNSEARIAQLETQNRELTLQQEQFKLLREQSSPGFKLLRMNSKAKSTKMTVVDG